MNTQILKVTKVHFYVYFNLNLNSYVQLFVIVFNQPKIENNFIVLVVVKTIWLKRCRKLTLYIHNCANFLK